MYAFFSGYCIVIICLVCIWAIKHERPCGDMGKAWDSLFIAGGRGVEVFRPAIGMVFSPEYAIYSKF